MFKADYKNVNGKPICEFENLGETVKIPCTLYEGFWIHRSALENGEVSTFMWTIGIESGVGVTTKMNGKKNAMIAALLIKSFIKNHKGTTIEEVFGSVELAREAYEGVKELMV